MKCPICHGKGRIQDHKYNEEHTIEYLVYCEKKCEYCNGTGEVNEPLQTNEKWFNSLSTAEKAIWLEEKMMWAAQEQGTFTAKDWLKWLKEKHE